MKPNNLNDSHSEPLMDAKHLSLEQIPPSRFPLLLDAQKTKSDKLAEIAIFKGACQKLSELSQLVEFLKAYSLRVIVEIGTLRGGTFWLLCQLAQPEGTIVSIDLPGGDFGGGYSSEELTAFKSYGATEQSLRKSYQNWEFTEPDDDRGWGQWGGMGILKYDSLVKPLI